MKRYETDEIPNARLSWKFGGQAGSVRTDEEGFFGFHIPAENRDLESGDWETVHLKLEDAPSYERAHLSSFVPVRTPGEKAEFGIISDIDDTMVTTGATNFAKH